MTKPLFVDENIPYTGKSLSMKVKENNYVGIPEQNFSKTIDLRHGSRSKKNIPLWSYIPEENDNEDLVCQIYDLPPKDNFEKYELAEIKSAGISLHPDSPKVDFVKFIGKEDHIDIVKAEERKEGKRKR